ncbi:MAG TPA: alanine racemase [Longimicrobium sp.]|jgi:D-serine deaminase-like pyridoxal phosphate-dependent protein|nr:alanine racemase [Longimicrobium sp.]
MPDLRTLDDLETPAAVVDVDRMRDNLRRAAEYCRAHGLGWRPHTKTHKIGALAAEQVRAGAIGVTLATPREAEVMATAVDDLLLAYPPLGRSKLDRLMALPERVRLTVGLDSAEALRGLADAARAAGRRVGVLVELDVGMRRVGVQSPEEAVALATQAAELDGVEYRGVMYYPGHIRVRGAEQDILLAALAATVRRFIDALADAGLPPRVVSGGSTPTFWRSHEVEGTTEVRPGTNIFNDRTTFEVGACTWEQVAYSVLATVVSTAVPGQAVVDAGAKAIARDPLPGAAPGLGALLDRPDVLVSSVSEEHGVLDLSATDWRPRVGDRVRVVPNHVCVSVNLQERLWGIRGDDVVEEWMVEGRGRSPLDR